MEQTSRNPDPASREAKPTAEPWAFAVGAILLLHAALLAWSAVRNSVTFDEYAHLPAGVAYWKYREFSIHNLSPPLLRMLAAWPATLAGADAPPASSYRKYDERERHWVYAEAFQRSNVEHYHRDSVLGRLAMVPWSCLGAWIVFVWARQLYGAVGGVASCALYALDPNILAHASLVGTDAGVAVAMLGATYLWQRFCRAPDWRRALVASLAVAAAVLCKFTALLIVPVVLGVAAWAWWLDRRRWRELLAGLVLAGVVVVLGINLMYGYWRTFEPLGALELQSSAMRRVQSALPSWTPVPLPRNFVLGFDAQKYEADLRPPAYALGEQYRGARWYYYPLALACKLPLGTWALVIVIVGLISRFGIRRDEWPLIIMLVVFAVGMALLAEVNVGLRYVLPILPPLFVLCGRVWDVRAPRLAPPLAAGVVADAPAASSGATRRPFPRRRIVGWALLALVGIESLAVAPRFLSFFNVAVGGPSRAQFILNDSNFDWGQGLLDLRAWMRDNNVDRVGLAYFGRVDPALYGIAYTPLTEPGDEEFVAISSYYLTGMPHRLPTPGGPTGYVKLSRYRELQRIQPLATVGRVMYVYRRSDVRDLLNTEPVQR